MAKVALVLGGVVLVFLLGAAAYLAFVDVPAPTSKVEKILPDARFPK